MMIDDLLLVTVAIRVRGRVQLLSSQVSSVRISAEERKAAHIISQLSIPNNNMDLPECAAQQLSARDWTRN